ncbi:hypothetical protein Tco_1016150 [Tanacetum coccineum]|uniref:Reverse transcriptase Ty1/copia-type domain-containing protein n=1 Tax=Tanacetum coccineum TaxID=301880 RepID=A0ABQ5FMT3_9ASTR
MDNTIVVSPIPTLRIHKDHPKGQILGDPTSAVQTRGKIQKASSAQQALVSYIHKQNRTNHKDHQNCLFACFLSQEEPKTISQALKDESWVNHARGLHQLKLSRGLVLVDLPFGKKAIGTKWVFRNKRDKRSIVVKNKASLPWRRQRLEKSPLLQWPWPNSRATWLWWLGEAGEKVETVGKEPRTRRDLARKVHRKSFLAAASGCGGCRKLEMRGRGN